MPRGLQVSVVLCPVGLQGGEKHWKKDGDNVDGQEESPTLELASSGEEIMAAENQLHVYKICWFL